MKDYNSAEARKLAQLTEYEKLTQNKFGKLLERDRELATAIEGLQFALMENDTYKALVKLQDEREHLFDDFKAERLKEFQKKKIKTVDGVYGKITMTERTSYKVLDETAVPDKFKTKQVNMDLIKKEYLLNKEVPGIEKKTTYGMLLTPKRNGESS